MGIPEFLTVEYASLLRGTPGPYESTYKSACGATTTALQDRGGGPTFHETYPGSICPIS